MLSSDVVLLGALAILLVFRPLRTALGASTPPGREEKTLDGASLACALELPIAPQRPLVDCSVELGDLLFKLDTVSSNDLDQGARGRSAHSFDPPHLTNDGNVPCLCVASKAHFPNFGRVRCFSEACDCGARSFSEASEDVAKVDCIASSMF